MKALFISNDNPPGMHSDANTSYYRVLIPLHQLRAAGHDIAHQATPPRFRGNVLVDMLDWTADIPEVVLVERMLWPERVRKLRLAGARRIVLTFDDNYTLLPKYSSVNAFWAKALPGFLASLPLVDEVVVPSRRLMADFEKHCQRVSFLPNFHDETLFAADPPPRTDDRLVLGWGGSEQHLQSWTNSACLPALRAVLEARPQWKLVVYGTLFGELFRGAGIPVELRAWVPFERWPAQVKGFDLGLAPLAGDYDRRRSFLKPLEYALAGVPFIATDDDPYRDQVQGGLLVRNRARDWELALARLMDDAAQRQALAQAGRAWGCQYTMRRNVAAYERVLWGQS